MCVKEHAKKYLFKRSSFDFVKTGCDGNLDSNTWFLLLRSCDLRNVLIRHFKVYALTLYLAAVFLKGSLFSET